MIEENLIADIIQWDIKNWSSSLVFWDTKIKWDDTYKCLESGSREGGLSLWLALKGLKVICSDLKDSEKCARHLHKRYNVETFIQYQDIDATDIPYENYFDVIVFKSILGGIGRNGNKTIQKKVIDEIYKALKTGGKMLFAENLTASRLHQFFIQKFTNWGSSWRYISIMEMEEFLQSFSSYEIKTAGVLGVFGRSEKIKGLLATLDQLFLNKYSPERWRYLIYGIAEK